MLTHKHDIQKRSLAALVLQHVSPVNGWVSYEIFTEAMLLIQKLAQDHTFWLATSELKYVDIRVDMRTGNFNFTSLTGENCTTLICRRVLDETIEILEGA